MINFTDEEKVVEELRRRTINDVTPKMLEDVALFYRFAKARDFNLVEAEAMMRKHLVWRKELRVDTIQTDYKPPEVFLKYIPTSYVCFDKAGCLIRIVDCGRTDGKGLWNVAKKIEFVKFCTFTTEQDKELVFKRSGNQIGKYLFHCVYDFEELSYENAVSITTLQYLAYILKAFIDNYPESIRKITVINVPAYFKWIHMALTPLFSPAVVQKLQVFGTDGWKEVLLKEIDADDWPAYLGGNRTDPDGNPLCETFILRGKPIPKSYYRQRRKKELSRESGAKKVTVKPFSKEEIKIEVKEENSYLEWEFETKNRDINFSLYFREKPLEDFEPVELVAKARVDTSYEPEKGHFICEKEGIYTIVFDNSYSWFYSKEVYYRIGIKSANDSEFYISM